MTDLKRVIVYFTEEEKQEIEAISEAMGQSMSAIIGNVFRESIPHLKIVSDAVKVAKTNPAEAVRMMRNAGYDSQMTLLNEMKNLDK